MSLENALIAATEAITRLTTVLVSASEAGALIAPAAAPAPRASRAKKTEVAEAVASAPEAVAAVAAATVAVVANASYPVNEGDAPGTRYFWIEKHQTVYKQAPGDMDCTLPGALIVSGEEYLQHKAELEKKFPSAAAVAEASKESPAVVTTPASTASSESASSEPTFEQVVDKMRELHKAQQQAGMLVVLQKFGAAKVPDLKGKASNTDLIAAIEAQLLGL